VNASDPPKTSQREAFVAFGSPNTAPRSAVCIAPKPSMRIAADAWSKRYIHVLAFLRCAVARITVGAQNTASAMRSA